MQCAGTVAQVTFRWGLCSCQSLQSSADITTDSFSSVSGTTQGGIGGSIGLNGDFSTSGLIQVGGSTWMSGGLAASREGHIGRELHVGTASTGAGTRVDGDVYAAADVSNLDIGGTLFIPATSNVGADVTAQGGVVTGPVAVSPPCDCEESRLLDIAGIIADAKAHNDNAQIGLSPQALSQLSTPTRLDLPCGRYFLQEIGASRAVTIAVHGRTALFIEQSIAGSDSIVFDVAPGAELDVFVGGSISISTSHTRFGSPVAPAQSRFYIAGSLATATGAVLAGNFYLPRSSFITSGAVTLYGSVFSGSVSASQSLTIHYDSAILQAGGACENDAGIPFNPQSDGGPGPTSCNTCRDCGNQACVSGTCGACASNADCCAPLLCSQGRCVSDELN